MRVLSHDVEGDVRHGEHATLMKLHKFRGDAFELQFACRFKVREQRENKQDGLEALIMFKTDKEKSITSSIDR